MPPEGGPLALFPHHSPVNRNVGWFSIPRDFIVICDRTCNGHLVLVVGVVTKTVQPVYVLKILSLMMANPSIAYHCPTPTHPDNPAFLVLPPVCLLFTCPP